MGLSLAPALEQNVEFLNDCLEDVQAEQQKLSYHHRNLARNQQQLALWLQKRCGIQTGKSVGGGFDKKEMRDIYRNRMITPLYSLN